MRFWNKRTNFADVIELERHIEILLLWNDCVIVPGFGGFTASYMPARFDENDNTFIPPLRTLGFNPKLNINDSLLAQSYTESYDISYPDALKRIAEQADELKQHIYNEGSYTLNDIGTLYLTETGSIGFTPCEAGVLTPSLYSLSSFEMKRLSDTSAESKQESKHDAAKQQSVATVNVDTTKPKTDTEEVVVETSDYDDEEQTVSIRLSVLRNIAAVLIAMVGFFTLSTPINNSNSTVQLSQMEYGIVQKLLSRSSENKAPIADKVINKVQADNNVKAKVTKVDATAKSVESETEEDYFCLVLASHVTIKNAEDFVSRLGSKGYTDARILREKGKALKVVFGRYKTQPAAYNALNSLHEEEPFHDAWVYNVK